MATRKRSSRAHATPTRGREASPAAAGVDGPAAIDGNGSAGATDDQVARNGAAGGVADTSAAPSRHRPPARTSRDAAGLVTGAATPALLQHAVEEAARLLEADGAMIYLLDPADGVLHFAHDAGIANLRSRRWVRRLELRLGQGMFGVAVAERRVVVTDDYAADTSFSHAGATDRFVDEVGLRSMVVAPLVAGDRAFGGLGTFSRRARAFSPAQVALVRSLADHAAAAMANALLIEELDRSRAELSRRAEEERSLREISTGISAIRATGDIIQRVVDEAARLLRADGARIDLIDPTSRLLRWAYQSGADRPSDDIWPDDPDETLDQGVAGRAVVTGRPFYTGDYLADERFDHGHGSDTYIAATGIRSVMAVPLIGDAGPFGALTVYTSRAGAWAEEEASLLMAVATEASIALTNARLINELATSREALARRAEAEQALREIAARITAIREPSELLQHVVDEANRLVRADGTILDLLDTATGRLVWAYDSGLHATFTPEEIEDLWLPLGDGATGKAVAEDRVIVATDDLPSHFPPSSQSELFFSRTGFRSLIAAPIVAETARLGALEVYSRRPSAFDDADASLIRSLADQAAIAIQNARLIEELARSRAEIERRADAERTLREIAARITAIRDPDEILKLVIDAATRLLHATGGMIDLIGTPTWGMAWARTETDDARIDATPLDEVDLELDAGVSGLACATGRLAYAPDYLADERFTHTPERDAFVLNNGISSVIAAPLMIAGAAVGTITVYDRRRSAFSDADAEVLQALADQAAVTIANTRLIERLEQSAEEIRRRADAESTLRQIAANISAIRDSDVILQQTVDEAKRLLDSHDARIDILEDGRLVWKYTSANSHIEQLRALDDDQFDIDVGAAGLAISQGGAFRTGDYLADPRFIHSASSDRFVEASGIRSVIAVPLIGEAGPLGAISVATNRPDAYDDSHADLLQAVADQASIAIQNARLIEALERSQVALGKQAETERSLREMAARIAELRDPDELLRRIVEDARRLLGSDGAHLTRMSDDGRHVVPVVISGNVDEATQSWLKGLRFPLMAGINGLAAGTGEPVWTTDYIVDERIPRDEGDLATADRMGLRGMAAAPLRSPEGRVIGTLAVSYREPHEFDGEEVAVLKGLADHAAIAITNTNLYERLRHSESRYRHLVQNSPDIVWSVDAEARFSFVSDTCERLTGWKPEELLGRHFGALVHDSSADVAEIDWTLGISRPNQELRGRLNLVHRDGHPIPAEFIAMSSLDANGAFAGANGSVRDMTERDRLERELRDSEERYRFLVQNSPDIIFSTDAQGAFTYMSETVERMTGWRPDEMVGHHFSRIVDPGSMGEAGARWVALSTDPTTPQTVPLNLHRPDGTLVPVEVSAIGMTDDQGRFAGITGSTRDVTEREGLERDLRRQAAELAAGEERSHLARELHDSVTQALFSMTLLTRTIEMLLDRDLDAARKQLVVLRDLQREALAEMRALIFELRPGNLEQDGLMHALKTHTAALQGRIGLAVVVKGAELPDRLPIEIEEVLYRIAQEALHNVVKHAGARQVSVELAEDGRDVRLRVVDDGRGFDPASVQDGHLGVTGMRARATKIGAELLVRSRIGEGTTIEVVVPEAAIAASRARSPHPAPASEPESELAHGGRMT
ncbi:MAG TPA: GAF domain-containing protein [Candidatus Limnocylindrales bacterium]